jgi:WD40 repeat protein
VGFQLSGSLAHYEAAIYEGHQGIKLFPLHGLETEQIKLPMELSGPTSDPDGSAIYSTSPAQFGNHSARNILSKITLYPPRSVAVADLSAFLFIDALSVSSSRGKVAVAGSYSSEAGMLCGIFVLELRTQHVTQALDSKDCDEGEINNTVWSDISFSPDTLHVVAVHRRELEVIDLVKHTHTRIGAGFFRAGWSPDGKWIAASAFSIGNVATTIFDAAALSKAKIMYSAGVLRISWSPDSRYLLTRTLEEGCGPDEYSYAAFDMRSGTQHTIESSRCKVHGNDLGWIAR